MCVQEALDVSLHLSTAQTTPSYPVYPPPTPRRPEAAGLPETCRVRRPGTMRWAPSTRLRSGWERCHPWLPSARPVEMAQVLRTMPKPFRHVACYALNRNCLAFLPSSRSMKTRSVIALVGGEGWPSAGSEPSQWRAVSIQGQAWSGDLGLSATTGRGWWQKWGLGMHRWADRTRS